jgi:hypothetical protein
MQTVLELADELYQRGRSSGECVDYSEFEERVGHAAAEVERGVHHVALRGLDVNAPFIRVWGKHYRRVHRVARTNASLSGPVTIERTLYREQGQRNAPVLDPIATRAGVVAGSWLPRTARAVAHLVAQVTSREACATGRELMRLPYSRCSIERVGHAVGAEYLKRREQVEHQLIEAFEIPDQARSISISIDRTTVPMEEPITGRSERAQKLDLPSKAILQAFGSELDPRTQAVLREARREMNRGKRKIQRNYRMAYCATVTLHDERGDALHTIRYGRMPPAPNSIESLTHRDVHRLMQRVLDDVLVIRRRAGRPVACGAARGRRARAVELVLSAPERQDFARGAIPPCRRLPRARVHRRGSATARSAPEGMARSVQALESVVDARARRCAASAYCFGESGDAERA